MAGPRRLLGIILALLLLPVSSLASEVYYGSIVCDTATTVSSPFGGMLTNLSVRRGDLVHTGDQICAIETTRVYSPVAGTVSAVFGAGGDSVEEVKQRRGGVVYIVPSSRFTIQASIKDAIKNTDAYVSVGQTVWLQKGRKHSAITCTGIITSVATEGDTVGDYSVEFDSGSFALEDNVSVYRREDRAPNTLLGFGTIQQTPPVVVCGEGSILRVHVKPGSKVSRGTLLFETVTGTMKEMKSGDNRILAKTDGIVASVEAGNGVYVDQNSPLVTMYPLDTMMACISVPEPDLALFPVGQPVHLTFGTSDEREGTVESVDFLAETSENTTSAVGYANYKVYISFKEKDGIRQGMLVTVELP